MKIATALVFAFLLPLLTAATIVIRGPRQHAAGGGSVSEVGTPSGSSQVGGTNTFSHTVPSGADLLVVRVAAYNAHPTGVTFDGVSLSNAGQTSNGSGDYCSIYYLASPTATTANVVVTFAGSNGNVAYATNYDGVDSGTPVGTYVGDSDGSVDVTSETGGLVVDVISLYNATPTEGAGQTLESYTNNGASYQSGAFSKEAGASTVTMSWTGGSTRVSAALPINAQ